MLRVVGKAIKSEDPHAKIVTAGLPDSKLKSTMPLDKFISRLYKARGKRYFDTLAINGYATNNAQLSELLRRVRHRMNRKHDRRAGRASRAHRELVPAVRETRAEAAPAGGRLLLLA